MSLEGKWNFLESGGGFPLPFLGHPRAAFTQKEHDTERQAEGKVQESCELHPQMPGRRAAFPREPYSKQWLNASGLFRTPGTPAPSPRLTATPCVPLVTS